MNVVWNCDFDQFDVVRSPRPAPLRSLDRSLAMLSRSLVRAGGRAAWGCRATTPSPTSTAAPSSPLCGCKTPTPRLATASPRPRRCTTRTRARGSTRATCGSDTASSSACKSRSVCAPPGIGMHATGVYMALRWCPAVCAQGVGMGFNWGYFFASIVGGASPRHRCLPPPSCGQPLHAARI